MIPQLEILMVASHPEPLLKIYRKIGFARFAALVKRILSRLRNKKMGRFKTSHFLILLGDFLISD